MEKTKDNESLNYFNFEDKEDISDSVDYLKHVFGSVMDVIFGEDNDKITDA